MTECTVVWICNAPTGVVDVSSHMMAPDQFLAEDITLDKLFTLLDQYTHPERFDNTDHVKQYCRKQMGEESML